MRILVTGSSGFVGSHLVSELSENNEVVGYDLKDGENILNTKKLQEKLKNVEVVIHLAALVSPAESWEKPKEYFETNTLGTLNTLLTSIGNNVRRFIFTSSAAVYGDIQTPYSASKKSAEEIVNLYNDKIETVIIRPFNIYGLGQNPSYGYAIHNFIKGITKKSEISIYGDGKQTRDFISVYDVVDVIEHLMTSDVPNEPVDVGTGKKVPINDLAEVIGGLLDKDFEVKRLPERKEPRHSKADTRVLEKTGYEVDKMRTLENGLRELIRKV